MYFWSTCIYVFSPTAFKLSIYELRCRDDVPIAFKYDCSWHAHCLWQSVYNSPLCHCFDQVTTGQSQNAKIATQLRLKYAGLHDVLAQNSNIL